MKTLVLLLLSALLWVAGCSSDATEDQSKWTDEEVTFDAGGLTLHGT